MHSHAKVYGCITISLFLIVFLFVPVEIAAGAGNPLNGKWAKIQIPGAGSYPTEPQPTGLFLSPEYCLRGLHVISYPNHWWFNKGLSDTTEIEVRLHNNQGVDFPISGSPENWFDLEIFTDYLAAAMNTPIKSGTEIGKQFLGWKKGSVGFVSQPTSIPANNAEYSLAFAVWNLPEQVSIIRLTENTLTPSNVTVTNWVAYPVVTATASELRDTLNSFCSNGMRYLDRGNDSTALKWADSILVRNKNSLIGWFLKYSALDHQNNFPEALIAIDQVLWILESGSDPLIRYRFEDWDSNLTETEVIWLYCMMERARADRIWVNSFHRWRAK